MALTLRVLGPTDLGEVAGFDFYAGEERTLKLQLMERDTDYPHHIPSGATKTLILHASPTDLTIADGSITVDPSDSSIFTCSLTEAQTTTLISGDIKFQYVASGVTRIATVENAMKLVSTSFDS